MAEAGGLVTSEVTIWVGDPSHHDGDFVHHVPDDEDKGPVHDDLFLGGGAGGTAHAPNPVRGIQM